MPDDDTPRVHNVVLKFICVRLIKRIKKTDDSFLFCFWRGKIFAIEKPLG